jgi:uncharacterized membrane protein YeaQ/YmgE (transglycosylase-associated protein family)
MGNIAWIFLGRASGLLVGHLIPAGSEEHRASPNCVFGIAGALLGGWQLATCATWPPTKPPNPASN